VTLCVDLIVFDMIGTTVRPSPRIPEAFALALATAGVSVSDAEISAIRGKSKTDAIRELLVRHCEGAADEAEVAMVYGAFKSALLQFYHDDVIQPIDGVSDVFVWCRSHAISVALTTGFDRQLAELLVTRLSWQDAIDTLVCNDDVAAGRPAPDLILAAMERVGCIDVARVAAVGDTVSDLQAGANAGVGCNVAVLSGAHTREKLSAVPHDALLGSVADLPALLG
jgi:phosphonatase-like hydrolase